MNRQASLLVGDPALAVGYAVVGTSTALQAQGLNGRWVHQGPNGSSVLEFFPGQRPLIGPMRGSFHYSTVQDDGRVVQGEGTFIFRNILPNRGWLILQYSDGTVTREHEHTLDSTVLTLRHLGVLRTYTRQ